MTELKQEIQRLSAVKQLKEQQLRLKIKDASQQMKPINLIKSAFSSISGDKELKSELAIKGTEAALGFIVTNLLFKNSNPVVRTAATLLGTTFATKIFGEDSSKYIEKIKSIYEKFKKKHSDVSVDEFREEDIYKS